MTTSERTQTVYPDSINGRFMTAKAATRCSSTTEKQRVRNRPVARKPLISASKKGGGL